MKTNLSIKEANADLAAVAPAVLPKVEPRNPMLKTRSEFAQLSTKEKTEFCKDGGNLMDDSTDPAKAAAPSDGRTRISRSHFAAMTPQHRLAYIQNFGLITD